MSHVELWIPGPTEVKPHILAATASPQIGHRAPEIRELISALVPGVQEMFGTRGSVLFGSHSATGFMEAAVRAGVERRILHVVHGAFSERWYKVSRECDKNAVALEIPWGEAPTAERIEAFLEKDADFDAFAIVHNETSTGVLCPLAEIAAAVRTRIPEVSILVDCVTSAAATELRFDEWGLDAALTGSQKALALPPGLALMAVSERLFEKAAQQSGCGHYLDILALRKSLEKDQTPTTPATPQLFALRAQLEAIASTGGFPARFARHAALAARTRAWCKGHDFEPFPPPEFLSPSVACRKTGTLEIEPFLQSMRERGFLLGNGYGKLKGETFRIGHMGDHTLEDLERMLAAADEVLAAR